MGALFFLGFFWVILRMCLAILTKGGGWWCGAACAALCACAYAQSNVVVGRGE
jgi:hypothetical protein